ncbi:MAG: DUF937 domain-containing protein [Hydrogenophaga sp.]|jgi:hypothetical protein|uniref:DUF937 domain-containing protein n=1 Tax=Hydrogenophaga sp. TaxID=1904254 RepID=UPI000ED7A3E7|nr:DUF937 domain-containing protein [Hydrogenophaga sp.]MDD3784304.1 DUF937 domain-containing protein [Hydrogenophaga sp.]MDX9968560.1 DUF937 domain-containing protein [Hydrogenophaga sp.]HAJ13088.1 calcium-binding protein [Comamonadaceae bacterium]
MNSQSSPAAGLTDELFAQLQGAPLQQIARQLGTSTDQTRDAVGAALPLLLGALGRNAAQPQGAQALFGALQRDHAGGAGVDLGGLLGALLGGGAAPAQPARASDGAAILGHIFGGALGQAESGLGRATGLDSNKVGSLLQMLAPIVMSFLAQRASGGGLDASGLGSALGQERQRVQQRGGAAGDLLGSLLDQDGDGQVGLSDLLKIGGSLLRR